ncbi:unnamed protein product [Rangifer tarandus platyrhynchus]|uniref:Uncharacterized protein n=2 Tax=Rangifer tarandus platyrhynchus TaxID=3082113 RepID=A0ACB1MJY5_RANTA|nr:unnamed protein product [Rangifer tarandus platyrhynchus]
MGSSAVLPASRSPDTRLPEGLAWQLRGPAGGAHAMWEPPVPFSLNAPRVPAFFPVLTPGGRGPVLSDFRLLLPLLTSPRQEATRKWSFLLPLCQHSHSETYWHSTPLSLSLNLL